MGQVLSYAISSAITLACCYLAFKCFVSGGKHHRFNRVILYLLVLASLIAPLIHPVSIGLYVPLAVSPVDIPDVDMLTSSKVAATGSASVLYTVLLWIYIVGVLSALSFSLLSYGRIYRLVRKGKKIVSDGHTLVMIDNDDIAPFSWYRFIVMNHKDFADVSDVILLHERMHVKKRHWIDLLFAQAICVFQWFNPVAWLIRAEFRSVHEYQVDDAVISSGVDPVRYQWLLLTHLVGRKESFIVDSLNGGTLKKRILIMDMAPASRLSYLRYSVLLPALLSGILITSQPSVTAVLNSASHADCFPSFSVETFDIPAESASESFADVIPEVVSATLDEIWLGDVHEMYKLIFSSLRYPPEAVGRNIQGSVAVSMIIGPDGHLNGVQVIDSPDESLSREACRVLNLLPAFKPVERDGRPVTCKVPFSIRFKL